jgi:hypothetical protein
VKKYPKNTKNGGEPVTAKYISVLYIYIWYTYSSGQLRCNFRLLNHVVRMAWTVSNNFGCESVYKVWRVIKSVVLF